MGGRELSVGRHCKDERMSLSVGRYCLDTTCYLHFLCLDETSQIVQVIQWELCFCTATCNYTVKTTQCTFHYVNICSLHQHRPIIISLRRTIITEL